MRYLKLFEDMESDGYEKVSSDILDMERNRQYEFRDFTQRELDTIKTLVSRNGYVLKIFNKISNWTVRVDTKDSTDYILQITKLYDDWYVLHNGYSHNQSYFKCDQWYGMINCLKNEFGIK